MRTAAHVTAVSTALALVGLLTACGQGPTEPSEFPSISGSVRDMAFRPIADVRVEAVGGPGIGAFAVTNASGSCKLSAVSSLVRAAKDGYVTLTKTYCGPYLDFDMELSSPSVNMAGDYTLTFTADKCTELSDAARTRTYQAAMTPGPIEPNRYVVGLSGATLFPPFNSFAVGVAGSFAGFRIGDPRTDDDTFYFGIVEELTPSTSVAIGGVADASVGASSTFSASLTGTFEFCAAAIHVNSYQCGVPRVRCHSSNHSLTLTRR